MLYDKTIFLRLLHHFRLNSTTISVVFFFYIQHSTPPPSQHHSQTPDLKWAMVIIFMLIVGKTKQKNINNFCSILEMIQAIIHPNSKFKYSLCLEIAKNRRQKQSFLDRIFRSNSSLKMKLK